MNTNTFGYEVKVAATPAVATPMKTMCDTAAPSTVQRDFFSPAAIESATMVKLVGPGIMMMTAVAARKAR
jgi:hypothetical protein